MIPVNQRRQRLRAIAQQELLPPHRSRRRVVRGRRRCARRSTRRGRRSSRSGSSTGCSPAARRARGKRRAWTAADQLLVDEANSILNGRRSTYGHVVVDEAQDHSAVALRVIGRRSPAASMTLVGDVAQSTTPAGQERWDDVFAAVDRPGGRPPATSPS